MRCDVEYLGKWLRALVLDVSDGGLALRIDREVQQGTNLLVRVSPPGRGQIEVRALVWHTRKVTAASGERVHVCGMVLTDDSPEWVSWVQASIEASMSATAPDLPALKEKAPTRAAPEPPAPQAAEEPPPPPPPVAPPEAESAEEADLASYRIRLKARSGPRTRTLSLSAVDEAEARRLATEQFGGEWDLLEVYAA